MLRADARKSPQPFALSPCCNAFLNLTPDRKSTPAKTSASTQLFQSKGPSSFALLQTPPSTASLAFSINYDISAVTASPYLKLGENTGFGLSLAFGAQRDDFSPEFRPGGHATAEANFGIYQPWALKVSAGGTLNQRLGSGASAGTAPA